MVFEATLTQEIWDSRMKLTSKKAEDNLMWEMCCDKNPGDADAYLNDPESHPQTRLEKTTPARIPIISHDQHCRNLSCIAVMQNRCPPLNALHRGDIRGDRDQTESRGDHHIPHT